MRWLESALFTGGIIFVGMGLVQWFGVLRAERDPAVVRRTRRVSGAVVALGVVALVVHLVLVLG